MTKQEYNQKMTDLKVARQKIQNEISRLKAQYTAELLEYNGYIIGDQFDADGTPCIITGVDECVGFYLQLKKIKKDGTPSEKRVTSACLRYKLKEPE